MKPPWRWLAGPYTVECGLQEGLGVSIQRGDLMNGGGARES